MPRPKLLALDVDGTLLRSDGFVDPRDRAAIARAREAGVTVTLATGRLASGSLAIARALKLDTTLVCADGASLVDPVSGAILDARTIDVEVAEAIMLVFDAHALSRFVFTHDVIHGDEIGRPYVDYVSAWTRDVQLHQHLAEVAPWRAAGAITMAIGIGEEADVARAHAVVARDHESTVDLLSFGTRSGGHALRMLRRGVDKADGLSRLCARLGIEREEVVVVGDWLNDLSMFAWAGRSFAMGQAPLSVQEAATDRLVATSAEGGGVAEAIARALG
jgi:hypothetical protein